LIRPQRNRYDREELERARRAKHNEKVVAVIRAEAAWLDGERSEPPWPEFPLSARLIQARLRIGAAALVPSESSVEEALAAEQLYAQAAALWLQVVSQSPSTDDVSWIVDVVDAYADWTAHANGAGLDTHDRLARTPAEWNSAYYSLMASTFAQLSLEAARARVAHATDVPDEAFFGVAATLVREIDLAYFYASRLDTDKVVALRADVAARLMRTNGWRREAQRTENSVGSDICPPRLSFRAAMLC
jgi:hypothetical protein